MRKILPFIALIALAGCQPAEPPQSIGGEQGRVAVGPITSAENLVGLYRVAGLDGIDMAKLHRGMSVQITGDTIDVLENCVTTNWSYRFEGERLVTTANEGPTCRRALMQEESLLIHGFTGAQKVSRTAANGILFEGTGGSVTLFSQ